ncbi:MAG TPA: hypothetical protein VLA21_01320 [Candidatus Limnocylindria bacterium]|nr:hypothetical protein [Candidatus Limnocylindria bacterium]
MGKKLTALALAACAALLLLPAAQAAQEYSFPAVRAALALPDGVYGTVLTPDNLQENAAFVASRGGTPEAWAADFAARGVLLQAYDQENGRVLVVTALSDVDGKRYFDINALTPETRAQYRASHGSDGAYSVLGYRYDSISWKNFPRVGRFLQLRYSYREGGDLVRRGYQRRTIRNGFTVTLDMQVFGRQLQAADNSALNRVFDTLSFTEILPMPELPLALDETQTAPVETGDAEFTMKGKTRPGAKLTAVLMSFGTSQTKLFETTAGASGSYTLPVTLPGEDVYLMTLTVAYEGLEELTKAYNIRYQKGLLPVTVTAAPPGEFTSDEFVLTGVTAESGVTATLTVNGAARTAKPDKKGVFTFRIDTSARGAYDIRLTLGKKGLQERSFHYQSFRYPTREEQERAMAQSAVTPSYDQMLNTPDALEGSALRLDGYVTGIEAQEGEWLIRFALRRTFGGYADEVMLFSDQEPSYPTETLVTVYGEMLGVSVTEDASGQEARVPMLRMTLFAGVAPPA